MLADTNFITLKFEGGLAEGHRLPAYEASQSLYGLSRSIVIATNYLEEGRVRRREFGGRSFQLNIMTQREGSYEIVLELITNPYLLTVLGAIGLKVSSDLVGEFIKSIINRSVGKAAEPRIEALEGDGRLNSGDLQALVDAIEPAMRETHRIIGNGASQIFIINGDKNSITLDRQTKDYVNTSIEINDLNAKLFSIGSFNANSRYGRAFDFEEGRTIPFQIQHDVDRITIDTILKSISNYTYKRLGDNLQSAIALKYRAVVSIDGKTKKIIVIKARDLMTDL